MQSRYRSILGIVMALSAVAFGAADPPLTPRTPLRSVLSDEAAAPSSQLIVKFRDAARARPRDGGIVTASPEADDQIRRAVALHMVRFEPLFGLPESTLSRMADRAARRSRRSQPDLAGIIRVRTSPRDRLTVARALEALEVTEYVCIAPLVPPPCVDASPVTPDYLASQNYHGADPGLNMTAAWTLGTADGTPTGPARGGTVKIADCEFGAALDHEDLCGIAIEPGQTIAPEVFANEWDQHGTAVLGVLAAPDNGYGCVGLVPEASITLFPEWSVQGGVRRHAAIASAIAAMDTGDVILLEMQTQLFGDDTGPAELDPVVWTLVRNASDAGIIVVAAAGNGNQDLDAPVYADYRSRGDSGAIIVGAGTADTQHSRLAFSTFGNRVDLQGWGGNVFTLGYGTHAELGGDLTQRYTAGFNGTSSAAALVAGACAALQGLRDAHCQERLLPSTMRVLLELRGVAQTGGGGNIGPLPDVLSTAIALGLDQSGAGEDCNGNGIADSCDIASGRSLDIGGDDIPDECQAPPCPGDVSGSGDVGFDDLLRVIGAWGPCAGCPEDLNGNNDVGLSDLLQVLSTWGACP